MGSEPLVLIVDDHPVFREGLAAVLERRGFSSVHTYSGEEPVDQLASISGNRPWVAILDVRLASTDGIALCRALRARPNPPVVIMLSTYSEPAIVQAARDAGAFSYLSKEADADTIVEALRAGLDSGGTTIPDRSLPRFTDREAAVLSCLARGSSNKQIARELGIGAETVKDYLHQVFAKLEVSDRLKAVNRARELGLLDR
jgi:two-component system, NarL family, nitrate/nitrite response regulator NarL